MEHEAAEAFSRTELGVTVGAVTHLFPAHCILLVRKLEGRIRDRVYVSFVIQRAVRGSGVVYDTVDREGDVS